MVRFADVEDEVGQESSNPDRTVSHDSEPSAHRTASSESSKFAEDEKSRRGTGDESLAVLDHIKSAAKTARRKLHLESVHATGPSRFFNPTNVRVHVKWSDDESHRGSSDSTSKLEKLNPRNEAAFIWRSRDNRKGRNSVAVPTSPLRDSYGSFRFLPSFDINFKEVGKNILLMFTSFPYWDMAFWSGWAYTIGSVLFVIDGAFAWCPIAFPNTEFPGETQYAVGILFFVGALFYELGASMAYLEAVNDGSFSGSAMRRLLEGNEAEQKRMVDEKLHDFFGHIVPHRRRKKEAADAEALANAVDPEAGWLAKDRRDRPGSIYPVDKEPAPRRGGVDWGEAEEGESTEYMTWRWWPKWHSLRTHHVYEIGYIATAVQLFGATLYGMCGLVALPGIINTLADWQLTAAYWVPEIVASVCFLVASMLFTLETQEKWYKPEITVLGWWIGAWACVGSMGFLLCGIFGQASEVYGWAEYQSDLSSTWGSTGYLISSLLQWYEAINKRPVVELFNEPGEMKTWQVHPI